MRTGLGQHSRVSEDTPVYERRLAVTRRMRRCRASQILEFADPSGGEVALYTLSDPRDFQQVRYVGQSRSPARRYAQHITAARPWLQSEVPWWIREPALRPLYAWISALYAEECRMPVMAIRAWIPAADALGQELRLIRSCLMQDMPLLNREAGAGTATAPASASGRESGQAARAPGNLLAPHSATAARPPAHADAQPTLQPSAHLRLLPEGR